MFVPSLYLSSKAKGPTAMVGPFALPRAFNQRPSGLACRIYCHPSICCGQQFAQAIVKLPQLGFHRCHKARFVAFQ